MYTAYIYFFITDIYIFHTSEHDPNNPPRSNSLAEICPKS